MRRQAPPPDPNSSTNPNIIQASPEHETSPQGPNRTLVAVLFVAPGPGVFENLGPDAQLLICPYCNRQVVSRVKTEPNHRTRLCALGLCLLCMFTCIPCCWLPFCLDPCQGRNHYCPNCGAFLGTYHVDLSL